MRMVTKKMMDVRDGGGGEDCHEEDDGEIDVGADLGDVVGRDGLGGEAAGSHHHVVTLLPQAGRADAGHLGGEDSDDDDDDDDDEDEDDEDVKD